MGPSDSLGLFASPWYRNSTAVEAQPWLHQTNTCNDRRPQRSKIVIAMTISLLT